MTQRNFVPPPPPRRVSNEYTPYSAAEHKSRVPSHAQRSREEYHEQHRHAHPIHRAPSDEQESAEDDVSDSDSILEMAKRLDDCSVISDPSFICGPEPHINGMDPPPRDGRGSSSGAMPSARGSGLYSQRNSSDFGFPSDGGEDLSVFTDGSGSQYTDDSNTADLHSYYSDSTTSNAPLVGPRVGHLGGTPGPAAGPRVMKGVGYNTKTTAYRKNSTSPSRSSSPGNRPPSPARRSPSPAARTRGRSARRSTSPAKARHSLQKAMAANIDPRLYLDAEEGSYPNTGKSVSDAVESLNSSRFTKKRLFQLLALLGVILILIMIIILVTRKRNRSDDETDLEIFAVNFPTAGPTFGGLYFCPIGGPGGETPIRGCHGFVYCNFSGEREGDVQFCPTGTLFDVTLGICNHASAVECSTKPFDETGEDTPLTPSPIRKPTAISPTSPNIQQPSTSLPTNMPTMASPPILNNERTPPLPWTGPITTYGHQLSFRGIRGIGVTTSFERNMENYLNIFFTSNGTIPLGDGSRLSAPRKDDLLENIMDINIDLSVQTIGTINENNLKEQKSGDGSNRMLQFGSSGITVTYDQTTKYKTLDRSIPLDDIIRHPFDSPHYRSILILYLKITDPDAFSTLETIEFTDEVVNPLTFVTASPTINDGTYEPSGSPTELVMLTDPPTEFTVLPTSHPTQNPVTTSPTPLPTDLIPSFPKYATIQGFMWIDDNRDGFWTSYETPMEGAFVNLRACEGDAWKQTTMSNSIGQFQFPGVEEGEYYLEFFLPSSDFEFTTPRAGSNDLELDSDADAETGKSLCTKITSGFARLINAGFVTKETTAEPTPEPTIEPTLDPSPEPTFFPTFEPTILTDRPTRRPTNPPVSFVAIPTPTTFCAEVTTSSSGNMIFEFFGCSSACPHGSDSECPDQLRCFPSTYCADLNSFP